MSGRTKTIAAAAALLAVLQASCRSPLMQATPLYSGSAAASADRVNLWPLLYHQKPNLSLIWPVFEKTPDHLALRPLFSVYKLDRPAHQYNFLWPLVRLDFDEKSHWAFPFFWGRSGGSPYFVGFPAVW